MTTPRTRGGSTPGVCPVRAAAVLLALVAFSARLVGAAGEPVWRGDHWLCASRRARARPERELL